jgi:hypothetical protein
MIETIFADGSRFVGNGRTGLVFYPDGTVGCKLGPKGELKALTKNFSTDLPGLPLLDFGADRKVQVQHKRLPEQLKKQLQNQLLKQLHTLGVMDFVDPTARFADELATWMALARNLKDKAKLKLCMKRLGSVVAAAQSVRAERFKTDHHKFITELRTLARKLRQVPTRNEIGRALYPDVPYTKEVARRVSQLCAANDLDWLPSSPPGRPKKEIKK